MIKWATKRLVQSRIKDWEQTERQLVRTRYGLLGGWVSIVVNAVLSLVKAGLALLTGSLSLAADAIHSLSDAGTSLVIVISFRAAGKPADERHPFGHGRMEAVATLVISILIVIAGFELGKSGFTRLTEPGDFQFSWLAVVLIFLSVFIKEALARMSFQLSDMIGSTALEADSWHHRLDAISSVLVIVAFFGQKMGLLWIDGAMGLLISVMVVYTGFKIARDGIDELLGKPPSDALIAEIKALVSEIPEVMDVHDLIIHQYGSSKVISMHISVPDTLSLKAGHAVSEAAADMVNERFCTHTTVHLDPIPKDDPEYSGMESFIRIILDGLSQELSFFDLRIEGAEMEKQVVLELRAPKGMDGKAQEEYSRVLEKRLMQAYPGVKEVSVNIGATFAF
ncbi:cation transporter [bacterium]|nr:cation transporter [bacterium]